VNTAAALRSVNTLTLFMPTPEGKRPLTRHEPLRALVAHQEVPVAVHHQGREGLLLAQGEVERALDVGHLGRVERGLPVHRRVTRGREQVVAPPGRHVEGAGQQQHHLAARLRAAGLDEGQVTGGDLRVDRQAQLAEPPPLPPLLDEPADRAGPGAPDGRGGVLHAGKVHPAPAAPPLPSR